MKKRHNKSQYVPINWKVLKHKIKPILSLLQYLAQKMYWTYSYSQESPHSSGYMSWIVPSSHTETLGVINHYDPQEATGEDTITE